MYIFESTSFNTYNSFFDELAKYYSIKQETKRKKIISYFDTFDWRLYNQNYCLTFEDDKFNLYSLSDDSLCRSLPLKTTSELKFWWDFPDSDFKTKLQSILDVRALLHLLTVDTSVERIRILNEDQKTIGWFDVEEITSIQSDFKKYLFKLEPLKGYDAELTQAKEVLFEITGEAQNPEMFFRSLLKAVDKIPGDYTSKPILKLNPTMTASAAATAIFTNLLRIMKRNEHGILSDIDTEFLHDFRVAVRRTRSALTQFKQVFPNHVVERFKKDFAWLGKLSNRLRDLDVYLLNKKLYQSLLPEFLRSELNPLFAQLSRERKRELNKYIRVLQGKTYNDLLLDWENFLNSSAESNDEITQNSQAPVIQLAKQSISKRYKKVLSSGKRITINSPVQDLHSMRIECKKLRYLLEFFSSVFHENEIDQFIKQLKKLQDNLGEFNDLSIQQNNLKQLLDRYTNNKKKESSNIAIALGGLISVLFQKQIAVRSIYLKIFEEFCSSENKALFHKLFNGA